jgi:hypothetical protein
MRTDPTKLQLHARLMEQEAELQAARRLMRRWWVRLGLWLTRPRGAAGQQEGRQA